MTVAAVLAGLVAAALSLFEVVSSRTGFTVKATGWALVRMVIDGLAGSLAYQPVHAAAKAFPDVVEILLAGAAGTAVLRSYVVTINKGAGEAHVGIISVCDRIKGWTDGKIAGSVTRQTSEWLEKEVEPRLRSRSCEEIIDGVMWFLERQPSFGGQEDIERLAPIRTLLQGAVAPADDRLGRMKLYRIIVSAGGRDELKRQIRAGRPA